MQVSYAVVKVQVVVGDIIYKEAEVTLESLYRVLLPPVTPIETGSTEEWQGIEKTIGIALPSDYKQYINIFGTGCIGSFLWLFNPFSRNKHLNLLRQIDIKIDALRILKEKWGDKQCPYPLYPEPEGLLPWGTTDNGDVLFWLTIGHPDEWLVVINEARAPIYEEYQESMTNFLSKILSGELVSEVFPNDFPGEDKTFVSLSGG